MDVLRVYATATAGYLGVQAIPILLAPTLLVTLLVPEPRRMSDLEIYLCRTLGLTFLGFAALGLALVIPVSLTAGAAATEKTSDAMPYAYPAVGVLTVYHALTAVYLYTQIMHQWNLALGGGMLLSSGLFCMGGWLLLFGREKGRVSSTTGADKRTSNFPFENMESAKQKKKESKRKSVSRSK